MKRKINVIISIIIVVLICLFLGFNNKKINSKNEYIPPNFGDTNASIYFNSNVINFSNLIMASKNVQDAVDLSLNNGITVETLDRLAKALEQGMKILKQGEEQRQAMVQANKAHLQQLDTVMDSYQEQFRLLESSLDNTSDSKSLVKKRNDGKVQRID